uniref:Large ribosomal subunit protein uL22c n=2 Tax=Psilotum nudum TaxID=3240 RepID=RK22_PSINU|nr:ribosomal protein L22 [Psilotum nudum]Q8WHY3.1 RecName: Full=Large ribosomal subunit protein uL22c; AltName: Full=50S ribosomal protein L22, chloroplastic [Psilotum nudum]AGC26833.1 ribosomal protein L22 [Psilotum nudum]BAB84256.1 ribosomal protein L22 [Psilotum nudum]
MEKKKEVRALAKYVKMSAHKVRRVINQIRGRSYEEALISLEFLPYRACYPLLQLVSSAAANANNNLGLKKDTLLISEAKVDEASVSKRFQPRAQGRAYSIQKDTCHITIKIRERSK